MGAVMSGGVLERFDDRDWVDQALRSRIADLEAENALLREHLDAYWREAKHQSERVNREGGQ